MDLATAQKKAKEKYENAQKAADELKKQLDDLKKECDENQKKADMAVQAEYDKFRRRRKIQNSTELTVWDRCDGSQE